MSVFLLSCLSLSQDGRFRISDGWLDGTLGPEALKPAPEEALREWKVSPQLNKNSLGDDDPTIIEPLTKAPH